MDAMRDKAAADRVYGNIPKVDLNTIVVGYKTVLSEMKTHYLNLKKIDDQGGLFFNKTSSLTNSCVAGALPENFLSIKLPTAP